MDVHVPRTITIQLWRLGIDVLTPQEDAHAEVDDKILLDRASALGRVLVSEDKGLLAETARRQRSGIAFGGFIFYRPLQISMGALLSDLRIIGEASEPEEWANRVEYLPL